MKKKPFAFNLLTALFIGIIVAFPVQIMFLYQHMPWEVIPILAKLSILNWMVIASCVYASYLAHNADPKLRWFLPVMTLLVAWNNLIVGYVGLDYSSTMTFLGTLAFSSINGIFLIPSVHAALGEPTKRWWQIAPRFKVKVPVFVNPIRGGEGFYTDTFDLSTGGTFIPLKPTQIRSFDTGEMLTLSFTLGTFRSLRCNAMVVRNNDARGNYPGGIGIKFTDLSRRQRESLQEYFKSINPLPTRQEMHA
jgi:hypothetical protein